MAIAYGASDRTFYLSGGDVSYVLHVDENGSLMNLYWGERIADGSLRPSLGDYPGNASFDLQANHLPWELPTRGSGWYGTPAVSAVNAAGDDVVVLKYAAHEIYAGKRPLAGLPATYVEDDAEADSLEIRLEDPLTGLRVTACYTVFASTGAIARSLRLENAGGKALSLNGVLPASVPLWGKE